jgi:acetyl-CoA carboxylase biotin carboxyl carrier protein
MIDPEFIERLIKALDESSLDSLEIERGGTRVWLSKSSSQASVMMPAAAPVVAAPGAPLPVGAEAVEPEVPPPGFASTDHLIEVTSPMVGTFYGAPAPDAPAYVEKGTRITSGDVLCIIEAMKLMNELESEVAGTIVEICVENAQPVEYGQVLFRVDPT